MIALAVLAFGLFTFLETPTGGSTQGGLVVSTYHLQAVGYLVIALDGLLVPIVLLTPLGVTRNVRYLLVALAVFQLWIVLLSPVGIENRPTPSGPALTTWTTWRIAVGSPGIWLSFASLILLFFKRRLAVIIGIVGAALLSADILGDQLGLEAWVAPPPSVSIVDVIAFATALAILYLAPRVYRDETITRPAISSPTD